MQEVTALTVSPASTTAPAVPAVPLRDLIPWAIFAGALMMTLLYFVGTEQGAASVFSSSLVHEFVHDARHLLGFPCH
ncbi:MAG: CbtB-domain containing protein [Actinomycetota bacterium]|nr:CbtB-domain containing protein [Actinomycetota bacterium]